MKPRRIASIALAALALLLAAPALAVDQVPAAREVARRARLDVDVWVNRDEGGVYDSGESMRVYFRTSAGAYVLLYNVDTEGFVHLLYPYAPGDPAFVEGGRTVAIPSRSDPYELVAEGPPGVEYVVAIASPVPFRNLPWFLGDARNGADEEPADSEGDEGYIVGDPYVGIERLNRRIIPPGREDEVATGETWFYIDRRVEYPRYVCADCHYHRPFFDPYIASCSVVDIRIDATWIRYAPVRLGVVKPRYYYVVRQNAPTRYRQWKQQWSSRDGRSQLRERFIVSHDVNEQRGKVLKERLKAREYFDIRRVRPGRVWQGRDEVLRLRERREEMRREREQAREQAGETRSRAQELRDRLRDRLRGRQDEQGSGSREPRVTPERRKRAPDREAPREKVEKPRQQQPRDRGEERTQQRSQEKQQERSREKSEQRTKQKEDRSSPRDRKR